MKLVRHTLHIPRQATYITGEEWDLTGDQVRNLSLALNAVSCLVDVDSGTIFAVNGKILKTATNYDGTE